jgi:hypothetical protein
MGRFGTISEGILYFCELPRRPIDSQIIIATIEQPNRPSPRARSLFDELRSTNFPRAILYNPKQFSWIEGAGQGQRTHARDRGDESENSCNRITGWLFEPIMIGRSGFFLRPCFQYIVIVTPLHLAKSLRFSKS